MARYILIDSHTGFIWGDSADLAGNQPNIWQTPAEFAAALDASLGETGREYTEVSRRALASNETGYHVYRADVGGSDAITVVQDGTDEEMIAAVERDCEYVTTLRITDAP